MPEHGLNQLTLSCLRCTVCVCVCVEREKRWETSGNFSSKLHILEQTFAHRVGRRCSSSTLCPSPGEDVFVLFYVSTFSLGNTWQLRVLVLLQNAHTRRLSNEILIRWLPVTCVCLKGVSGARRPGRWGICSVCSLFLTLSVSFYQPSEIKRKRLLNDTGWKGVREPLYIYGLCRTGGSGVVKWSHTPKPSLNSKYITDWGLRGNEETNEKKNPKRLRSTAINCVLLFYMLETVTIGFSSHLKY